MNEQATVTPDELTKIKWRAYREQTAHLLRIAEARSALRRICDEFGDNDWPDDLGLPDVIEKHLARNLRHSIPPVLEALKELCGIARESVELSDWPELKEPLEKAEKALENWK